MSSATPLATGVDRRFWQQSALIAAALFALLLAIIRACLQAITVDEASTYFWWVAKSAYHPWSPSSNNHILNSLLMWASTHALGTSSLTVRIPALLGAALYIFVCHFLCRSITGRFSLQFPIFICLVYNPFILDFMAAARGYSLANAFLLAAIAIPVWHLQTGGPSLRKSCALASTALGLSFTANFSFAFVDAAVFVAVMSWALTRRGKDSIVRILSFCIVPGPVVALLICGYALAHWPAGELWIGAHSLREMSGSLIEASLHQLNPRFEDYGWYKSVKFLQPFLLPLLGALCFGQLVVARLDGSWLSKSPRQRWTGKFAVALAAIVTLTVLLHWLAFRFYSLPLPESRTGIFLLPLCTLIAAAIAASPARSLASQWLRRGTTGALVCLACYFLLCLRSSYFEEYQWDADLQEVYGVLAELNHTDGATDVAVSFLYHAPLNFYRVLSKGETLSEFILIADDPPPPGKAIYVLRAPYHQSFIDKERLRVIYRGKSTEVVVAVRPDRLQPVVAIHR
jgi:hypothetical protein